ncbi:MAG: HAD-IA family hydrolase [Planctomycetes bacterium]|nr:HAD-IA family hydrolase [Planctomycetota bacterium]
MRPATPETTIDALLDRYEALFLDAYGVLIHDAGPLPGAAALITRLESERFPYFVLTNDASRSPAEAAERYHGYGVPVSPERVISSGALVGEYFVEEGLRNPRVMVLGGEASRRFVASLGATVLDPAPDAELDVMLPCGTRGYDFVAHFDDAMSALFRALDAGRPIHLVLPNPDIIYPRQETAFGFTAGGIAVLMEAALDSRFPDVEHRFTRLGKPHGPIFEAAIARAGTRNVVMIGDQITTDIRGANDAGIDSALVLTGIASDGSLDALQEVRPTWVLRSLAFSGGR